MELAERFLRVVGGSTSALVVNGGPPNALDEILNALIEQAHVNWPEISVPDQDFIEFIAERVEPSGEFSAQLRALHASDLYLACACLRGDRRAITAVERHFVTPLNGHALQSDSASAAIEDLKQMLRERVLVARDGAAPRLSSYNGRGPLAGWLRMVAARLAVDLRKKNRPHGPQGDTPGHAVPVLDLELNYLKERYRVEFEEAIEGAFRELSARDGALLRLHFLDNLSLPSIAKMYRVSARTVQRWVAAAQAAILAGVRRRLAEKFSLSEQELDSLIGLVISQLNVSLHRL